MNGDNILWEYIKTFLTSLLFVLFFINFIAIPVKVSGSSMLPNLNNGDFGFSGIITKAFGYNRFDIVVLKKQDSNDKIVKRIIGLPNEYVECIDNQLYINGEYIEQYFIEGVFTEDFKIQLNEDEYYVLAFSFTDTDASYYLSLKDSYKQNTDALPVYIVDLDNSNDFSELYNLL